MFNVTFWKNSDFWPTAERDFAGFDEAYHNAIRSTEKPYALAGSAWIIYSPEGDELCYSLPF